MPGDCPLASKRAKSASQLICQLSCVGTTRPDSQACSIGRKGGKSGQTRWQSSSHGQRWELEDWQREVLLPSKAEGLLGKAQPCLGDSSPGLCVVTGQQGSEAWTGHKPGQLVSRQQ